MIAHNNADFMLSKAEMLVFDFDGVFTDNIVYTLEDGSEFISCWRSDGIGLANVRKIGIPMYVISSEKNPVVTKRCNKLDIQCIQGVNNKLEELSKLIQKHGCTFENVVFVGNDTNDLECLTKVGLPITVADSHNDVIKLGKYITQSSGGKGAVREVCDLICSSKEKEFK